MGSNGGSALRRQRMEGSVPRSAHSACGDCGHCRAGRGCLESGVIVFGLSTRFFKLSFGASISGSMWKSWHKSKMRWRLKMREPNEQTSERSADEIANDGNGSVAPV